MSKLQGMGRRREIRGLTLRTLIPNAITAAAMCLGLTAIRAAIMQDWDAAVLLVFAAGILDGLDGRTARFLNAQSKFGAELDSLADSLSFGVAPALIIYLWSLQFLPRIGWFAALAVAVACALRLARFNARIDTDEQPHKSAGFLTGVPAPVGAGVAFLPMYLWLESGNPLLREPVLVAIWLVMIAFLMISNTATLSWTSLRPRRNIRLELLLLVGLLVAALILEPWIALSVISIGYLATVPYSIVRYRRIRQQRAAAAAKRDAPEPHA